MLQQADWRALGTGVRLLVHAGDIGAARDAVVRVLDDVDRTYSRFRDDSELSLLNAASVAAASSRVPVDLPVSPLLARALVGSLDAARQTGLEISSLAIGEMNSIPYKSDPRTIEWVSDCVDVMKALGVKVVLLAFFGKGDLRDDKPGTDEVVKRLKAVAPKAEKAGVIFGIESWLSAEAHMDIIQRVGSPAVKVYYDVCNSNDRGYDIYKEIRWLGTKHICEFHMKENGSLLGQGKVDFQKVRQAMDEIGYAGWMQIEGAVPKGAKMLDSYKANCQFLRGIFPKNA